MLPVLKKHLKPMDLNFSFEIWKILNITIVYNTKNYRMVRQYWKTQLSAVRVVGEPTTAAACGCA